MASLTSSKPDELHENGSYESTELTNESPGLSSTDNELHLAESDSIEDVSSSSLEKEDVSGEKQAELVLEEISDIADETSEPITEQSETPEIEDTEGEEQDELGVLGGTDDTEEETPEPITEQEDTPTPSPTEATYQADRDIVAPEAGRVGKIYTGATTTVETERAEINLYFGAGEARPTSDEAKQLFEKPDLSKEQLALDELQRERESYLERPGYDEALHSLGQANRLLLLTGPEGCGLHVSVKALSYDLNLKVLRGRGRVITLHPLLQLSPGLFLQEVTRLGKAIILFEEGLQTRQSLNVRLFQDGRDSVFNMVTNKLRQAESWMILTGPTEPAGHHAEAIYEMFRRHNQLVELGMPDMQVLLEQLIEHRCGSRATEILDFLSNHFPNAAQSLRMSQDVEHFARRCDEIVAEEIDIEERKRRVSEILVGLNNIQSDVRRLLEQRLQVDSDVLLAILLSVLNETESGLFWQIFDYVNNALGLDQESHEHDEDDETDDADEGENEEEKPKKEREEKTLPPRKRVFAYSRIERLRSIRAEEIVKKEIVDGEEIAYKVVRYVDDRYPGTILDYTRAHYEKQIADICRVLQTPFIEQQQDNVGVRIRMANAIAALAQTNWHSVLAPLLYEWATHPRPYMRATVGYALDQVLKEETYAGNARHLLNEWITAPFVGQTSWYLKWTVASVCKQIGLTDIEFGLEYLGKLALPIGQRDLKKARSFSDLVFMLQDSAIESKIVYDAIQYAMIVFCLQGYIDPVMGELQKWFDEPLDRNPLSLIATALMLGIFRDFGYMADHSRQAAIRTDWESDTLSEWSIQVYSNGKTVYIYNRVLQYLLGKLDDRTLLDAIASAIARSFAITKQANEHHVVYAIFFQWADELGAGRHVPELREGFTQLQKLFLNFCRQLDADDLEDVRTEVNKWQLNERLPEHVREFARRVSRDLNAPSMRYATRR